MSEQRIRLAAAADAGAMAAIYAPSVVGSVISFELEPPSGEEMASRWAATSAHAPWLVLERAGEIAGYAYASRHRDRAAYQWSLDASVYVHAAHRRTGVGRALYTSLFRLARRQGFYAVHAGITLPNDASVGLHESLGFARVGTYRRVGFKLGRWHDVGWWQLELAPREGEPAPPRTVEDAQRDAGWCDDLARGLAHIARASRS